jgi:hypothetical protein
MSRYGITASTMCDAILAAWETLRAIGGGLIAGGTGCVQSIARIEDDSIDSIARGCEDALPALLLCYQGGTYKDDTTTNAKFEHAMKFRIIACVGEGRTFKERFTGGQTNPALALIPGIEDIADWGMYFAARAVRTAGARLVHPESSSQVKQVKAGLLASYVDLAASRWVDVYGDDVAATFIHLGICKNPNDPLVPAPGHLFQGDNVTPKSDDANPGGVYTP